MNDENLRFTLDGELEKTWTALRFGTPWNGWLTPVVDRDTLTAVFDFGDLDEGEYALRFEGDTAVVKYPHEPDAPITLIPNNNGYNLFQLGWCFVAAE